MTTCAQMPATFLEALASTLVKNPDGDTFFNVICFDNDCDDLVSAIECGEDVSNKEALIVAKGFGVDACGNLAIKFRVCSGLTAENREQ